MHKAHSLKDRDIIAKDLEILAKEYPKEFSQYGREITQAIAQNPQVFIKNGRLNLPNIRELMGFIKGQEKPAIAYKGKAQDNLPSELRDSSAHKASTGFLSSTSKDSNKIIPQNATSAKKNLPTQKAESQNLQDTINELHDVSLRYFDKPYKIQTADIGKDRHFIGMAFENPREFKKVYQSTLERIIKTELDRNYPNSYHIALGTGKENGKTYATINIQISKNPTQDTFYKLESQKGKGILERVRDLRLAKEKKTQAILENLGYLVEIIRNSTTKELRQ